MERILVIDDDDEKEHRDTIETNEENGRDESETNAVRNAEMCPDCEGFRANADAAWKILSDYQRVQEENRSLKTEKEQLKRICEENRVYISTLRTLNENQNRIINERHAEVQMLNEKLANIEDQYNRVCKAAREAMRAYTEVPQSSNVNPQQAEDKDDDDDLCLEMPPTAEVPQSSNVNPQQAEDKDDDDDFSLEIPPSPNNGKVAEEQHLDEIERETKKAPDVHGVLKVPAVPPIETMLSSSFLMEMRQMPLISDIGTFQEQADPIHNIEVVPGQPSRLAIHQISKKYNIPRHEAALYYTNAQRNKQRLLGKRRISSSDEEESSNASKSPRKTQNRSYQMPWRPVRSVIPLRTRPSSLSYEDHRRYIAIIVNQLKAHPTFRFEHNKIEIQALDHKLAEEREYFEKNALQIAKSFKAFNYNPEWRQLFLYRQKVRIEQYIGRRAYQKQVAHIQWPTDCLSTELPMHIRMINVLSLGDAPTIEIPSIQNRFILPTVPIKQLYETTQEKIPIFDDAQAQEFALANDVSFILDASTLRHLMCSTWSHRLQKYACRLSIATRIYRDALRRIFIISPPLIASRVNKTAVPQALVKLALKRHLLTQKEKANNVGEEKMRNEANTCQSLLNELGLEDVGKTARKDSTKLGKRYAIITFDEEASKTDSNQQILIRTRVHAIEKQTNRRISLTGRAEFLPEVGAEKLTSEEIIWNTLTGILKGTEEHLNFRIRVPLGKELANVLQYDRKPSSDLGRISGEARNLLRSRIQRFLSLKERITDLDVGEYLIVPDPDADVLNIVAEKKSAEMTEGDEEDLDGMEEDRSSPHGDGVVYDADWFNQVLNNRMISSINEMADYWNCLDPHYPLQWHVVQGQIPGALKPQRH